MRLLVLAHVDGDQLLLATVQRFGQRQRGFGLAHAAGAGEQEHALGLVRVFQVGARGAHALGHGVERVVLPDHARLQQRLELEHVLDLVLDHLAQRDAGPGRDDLGHHVAVHLHGDHGRFTLQRGQFGQLGLQLGLGRGQRGRSGLGALLGGRLLLALFCGGRFVCDGRGLAGLLLGFQFFTQLLDLGDQRLLFRIALGQGVQLGLHRVALGLELGQLVLVRGAGGGFTLQRANFHRQAFQQLGVVFHGGRHRALAQGHLGTGGVEHADGLVGQLAAADVACRQAHGFGNGLVEDAHVEVLFHQRGHATQHGGGNRLGRLFDLDHLKAARQGGVLLEVLLVFRPGGGSHGAQLTARQRRLQEVGRIVLPGLTASTDHGVGFVDEQDDGMRALLDLVDHVLQAIFKLALDAGAGLQQAHVQRVQLHALQRRRHVARGDAQGQTLDHGRLAHAGLAGEDRVVLPAAHQDVDGLADFRIAADHRVQLAVARALGEVGGELVQRGRFAGHRGIARGRVGAVFGDRRIGRAQALRGFFRTLGDLVELVLEIVQAELRKQLAATEGQLAQAGFGQQGQQQVAAADAAVVRVQRRDQPGVFQQRGQVGAEDGGAGVAVLESGQLVFKVTRQRGGRDIRALAQQGEVRTRLLQQGQEQVFQIDLEMRLGHAEAGGAFGRAAAVVVELGDQGLEVVAHEGVTEGNVLF